MSKSDEATPSELRMDHKLDLLLEKTENLIAERDAALAKVKQCPQCDRPSIAAFYEYPSMDTVCPLCSHEEQIKLWMAKVEDLDAENKKIRELLLDVELPEKAVAAINKAVRQQVTGLREALESVEWTQGSIAGTKCPSCLISYEKNGHEDDCELAAALAATKPAETEGT